MKNLSRVFGSLMVVFGLMIWAVGASAQPGGPTDLGHRLLKGDPVSPGGSALFAATAEEAPPMTKSLGGFRYQVLQFEQPVMVDDLVALRKVGIEPVDSLNRRVLLVRTSGEKSGIVSKLQAMPQGANTVRWSADYLPTLKISDVFEDQPAATDGSIDVIIHTWPGEPLKALTLALEADGAVEVLDGALVGESGRLQIRTNRSMLPQIAARGEVRWIEPAPRPTQRNDAARGIIQSGTVGSETLWARGLRGEGQILGHIDGGIDMDSCFFEDTTNNTPRPDHRKVVAYRGSQSNPDLHGTHTAGTVAGLRVGSSLDLNDAGHAYAAKISHTNASVFGELNPPTSLFGFLTDAQNDGAYLHTNSYGEDHRTDYSAYCVDIDQFMYENEDALVIFAATNQDDLRSPENAKNVLAVGATSRAPNEENHATGGFGPTFDGRRKPEIYAPGASTVSADTGNCSIASLTGTSMACPAITASGGLVRQYFMEGFYPTGSRVVENEFTPSGALVKAVLLNSTVDMEGDPGYPASTDFDAPSNTRREGWGRLRLDDTLYFDGEERRFRYLAKKRDELTSDTEGAVYTLPFNVVSNSEELRVTFTWIEPAGALESTAPMMHDLDLEVVSPDGVIYPGNTFSNGFSIPGTLTDTINNVEMVILESPKVGQWSARIRATSIDPLHGVPGFALVASGVLGGPLQGNISLNKEAFNCDDTLEIRVDDANAVDPISVTITTSDVDTEAVELTQTAPSIFEASLPIKENSPTPDNGTLEVVAGSTFTVSYLDTDVDGSGTDGTINLMSEIDCSPPNITEFQVTTISDTSATLTFVTDDFLTGSFDLSFSCEGPVEASAPIVSATPTGGEIRVAGLTPGTSYYIANSTITDAAGNLAKIDAAIRCFSFRTLDIIPLIFEDFESPPDSFVIDTDTGSAGWSRVNTEYAVSPDHAYFCPDTNSTQDARLETPEFTVPAQNPIFRFWHTHEFEIGDWDGGVLEISTNGGTNWIDAEPYFTAGGYNGVIRDGTSNPLDGQNAWVAGTLGAMKLVELDLGAFAGETMKIRWRLGADGAVAGTGWYIDDVLVAGIVPLRFSPDFDSMITY